ncbi:aldo/keto reductase [Herbiconiux daphne]|uniref:Aldo/keto reductase n=1 Tax=Herbiconiux daphne TaxID=2970914 RepID=A0ABT2H512_9MICO|nr:aldo/keto reductase [Herbiconiux daphne]MCS5735020.1 aldo/keto reductase [Herbiconiux daphne]
MNAQTTVPLLRQNDGREIPQIGLGIYGPDDSGTADAVAAAIEIGYRSIDTAALYQNEVGVGDGIRRSQIDRAELYVTTKLADDSHGYDSALRAFDTSLDKLGLDYVDLYLIHWPLPGVDKYVDTWRAFEKLQRDGRAKSIGVSNFQPAHLQRLFDETDIRPVLNQIELHPGLPNVAVREFNTANGILTEAWSPLGRGRVFGNAALEGVAQKHGKSVAQVVIRWQVEQGNVVIPKSITPERLAENIDVYDFSLDDEDRAAIATLENGQRTGDDPDTYNG